MKRVKLFEQFLADINPQEETKLSLDESMMSEIDLIGQDAPSKDAFMEQVVAFLRKSAADPKAADNKEFIEELSQAYFNEDGTKKNVEA